jgi:putative transposase
MPDDERFLGSVRRECLDHIVVLHEKHVYRVLKAYVEYFNHMRPHQGIKQQVPESLGSPIPPELSGG